MDKKQEQIAQMLSLIMDSSHRMPDYVFHYYVDFKKSPEEKIFYNLISDSFLTLFAYSKLMFENAWSQAFTLLRMGIEQVAAVFLLTSKPGALQKYIELYKLQFLYINIESKDEEIEFLKSNNIPKNRIHDFFDYSWVSDFTSDGSYGRDQLLELAKLEEFKDDIKHSLNSFSHGSMSVFQMSGDNWDVMKRYGRRASMTCCKLYDFLCYSYFVLIGGEEFSKLPLANSYKLFKSIYQDYISNNKVTQSE